MNDVIIDRFQKTFTGLHRAFGLYKDGRPKTIRSNVTRANYTKHLDGVVGLGIVPIMDTQGCYFGAIDIDDDHIDHRALAKKVEGLKLPLIVCRSKSGGAHLYTFMDPPFPAEALRKQLSAWASKLGFGQSEIFPKQDTIGQGDVGNWINLPYFNVDETRCAFTPDGPIAIKKFLDRVDEIKGWPAQMAPAQDSTGDMPPCIQFYFTHGIPEGARNEILYNFGVYLKKSSPDQWEEKLQEINYQKVSRPLSQAELKQLIKSLRRKEYQYKCKSSSFLQEHCDRVICQKAKWGVLAGLENKYSELMLGCLTKHMTDPPKWVMDINGIDVVFTTEDIMDFRKVRAQALERANVIAPPMKQEEWLLMLKDRVAMCREVEAPKDASAAAQIMGQLTEFLKTSERSRGRQDLLRGFPVKDEINVGDIATPVILFRSQDFVTHMKRRKVTSIPGNNILWMTIRRMGCGHTKVRIVDKVVQVWYAQVNEDNDIRLDPITEEIEI